MPYEQNSALMRCRGVHRVTDLEKFPVWISKDEAPYLYSQLKKKSSSNLQG